MGELSGVQGLPSPLIIWGRGPQGLSVVILNTQVTFVCLQPHMMSDILGPNECLCRRRGMPSSHPNAAHGSSPLGGGGSRSNDATWTLNKSWVAVQSWVDVTPKPHLFF